MSWPDKNLTHEIDARAFLERTSTGVTLETYLKNERIFTQGDPGDSIGYVRRGMVKATILSAVGKEAIVGIFQQGQFFGEACLAGANVRTANIVALEDCAVTLIARDTMLSLLHMESAFSAFFLSHLISRNDRLEGDLIDQLLHSTEERLARLLLRLADLREGNDKPVPVSLSQETLAEMIGTTRSRVSTFMNKFRERGFISYDSRGRIQVYATLLLSVLGS
ncbi:putative transcriptional regulator Crp/Fnr family [Bradyrhizobium sp. STM 3843]|uniref:Crp/Fnr family transcriptional regulator n=1 Tax=unclassified Bradyrhizobium TaxID=2631580 RepID=UPI0002407C9A|nr:Crp/Fnr family transcriptional regulator [Bradyrhizobium sp. STM 3843]CCE04925.1 putative transcriptional regulator Crp/Fnr family [Bradyrhizobium sp. STM 3843]